MNRRDRSIIASLVIRIEGDHADAVTMRDLSLHDDNAEQRAYWNGRAAALDSVRRVLVSTIRFEQSKQIGGSDDDRSEPTRRRMRRLWSVLRTPARSRRTP